MSARDDMALHGRVLDELLSCYGEGENTDWPYLTDLANFITSTVCRETAALCAQVERYRPVIEAACAWQEWAAAHPDDPEGNADQDTVLYRVVSEYRQAALDSEVQPETIEQRHTKHYRNCNCLADTDKCCDPNCPVCVAVAPLDSEERP